MSGSVAPVLGVEAPGGTVGPDVIVPGSQQVLPVLFLLVAVVAVLVVVGLLVRRRVRARRELPRRRPVGVAVAAVVALVAGCGAWATRPPPFFVPRFAALPTLMPPDNLFLRSVADLPVSSDSERWIASIEDLELSPSFSGEVVDGVVFGIPYNFVDDATPRRDVTIRLATEQSDPGPYPITDPAYIEAMPTYHFDMHYVGIDVATHDVWELLSVRSWFGRWEADAGARYRTDSNDYPRGWTIAAGLPLLPGTVTYDQVAAGSVDHVVLGALERSAADRWIWPARATDGRSTSPDAVPQGAWLRLRADADLSGLGPQARVIATGLQRYGMVLSDTGPGFGVRGTPDARWDQADIQSLRALSAADFEVVDPSGIVVSPDSLAVRPPA
ncbi:hypothetical protein [Dermatobacter hominis]|uniref:hypothetical protein n=1 Tax=Dermatobacter hominis TaxID=2884263 RepID=UPI001D112384|nr:hypothetical protein [Dermatobacter hominis]UDY37715.1 hypothetical protein LH044_09280 [Dermatobacter hominis]